MALTQYGDISPRTAAYASKELLKRGLPYLQLEKFGQMKSLPSNSTKTIRFRRYSALPNDPVALQEGITPAGQSLTYKDIEVTLQQYGGLITVSDVVTDTHEDPVLNEATEILGEQAAQMVEKLRWGVLKGCTNRVYANGTSLSAVNTAISKTMQRRAVRALKRQNARFITSVIRSTPAFGTENVAPGFIGLVHPDCEADIRSIDGFVPSEKYGSMTPFENEIGKVEDVRYLSSTIFEPYLGGTTVGGVTVGGSAGSMLSANGSNADVYPVLYLAKDAWAGVALKGLYGVTPMVVNAKPSDSDPLAQRSHVGYKTMQNAIILNDGWMVVGHVAVTA